MLDFRDGLSLYICPIVLDTMAQNSRAGGRVFARETKEVSLFGEIRATWREEGDDYH